MQCLSPGSASILAQLQVEERSISCEIFFSTFIAGAEVRVNPRIDSISPARGLIGNTTTVTINGIGFAAGASVNAGTGISVSNIAVRSAQEIQANFNIAADAPGGNHSVTVTVNGQTSNSLNFFVQIPSRLRRDSISELTDEPGGRCGASRELAYTLVDQAGEVIMQDVTVQEVLSNFTSDPPGLSPPEAKSPVTNAGHLIDTVGYTIPTCPPPFTIRLTQTFTVNTGQITRNLSTANSISFGRDASGNKFVNDTNTTP
ncbi:MAG: IPT/TIG domain-containing protein [Pyrinomonadaceae bacterium]